MPSRTCRFLAILSALMVTATACGGQAPTADTTTDGTDTTTAVVEGYDYKGKDYGGYEFKILTFDEYVSYINLDFEELTGESLDDAVWNRNRKVESELNFVMSPQLITGEGAWGTMQAGLCDVVIQSVMAGDYAYDAAYLPLAFKASIITDGYLYDLNELPGLNLDAEYWDHNINDALEFGGKLYAASSPLQFQTLDMADILLFNEDLFTDLKLDYPYDLVREGKWTLDAMQEYITELAQLNGDDSFAFSESGNARYGIAVHGDMMCAFPFAAGNSMAIKGDGSIEMTLETERWHNSLDKICTIVNTTLGHAQGSAGTAKVNNYLKIFRERRTGFVTAELKATLELRDMQDNFGLLPMPKYDEDQEDYLTMTGYATTFLTVPKLQKDPERTGMILDALSYESYESVLPIYYDVTIEQKGLRNEDSIEMLDIIREGRSVEFTRILGVTDDYTTALNKMIATGTNTLASLAASHKTAIEAKVAATLDAFE